MRRFLKALFIAVVAVFSANLAWELARKNNKDGKNDNSKKPKT